MWHHWSKNRLLVHWGVGQGIAGHGGVDVTEGVEACIITTVKFDGENRLCRI